MTLAARSGFIIACALAGMALLARVVLAQAPRRLAIDLAQPLAVVTDWHAFGFVLLALLIVALAIGGIAYARLVRFIDTTPDTAAREIGRVVLLCAVALACAWAVPVLYSSDVYAYAAYGEMARLGIDPYAHALLAHGNPLFDAAVWQWGNPLPVCVYGPAFVWIAHVLVGALAALGTIGQLNGLRALSSGALVACALLAYAAYPGAPGRRFAAAATIALNPAAIWCAAEGHNDALVLAVVLAGFALYRRGALSLGAAVVALSGALKLSGCMAALPFVFGAMRARIGAAVGWALALAISLPLLESAMTRLAPHGRYTPQASFQAIVQSLATLVFSSERVSSTIAISIAAAAALALSGAGIVFLHRGRREGWAYFALAAWVLVPNPYPWYGLWLAAIAALVPGSRVAGILLLLTFSSLLRYVPDAVGTPSLLGSLVLGTAASLPLLALIPSKTSVIMGRHDR